MKLRDILRKVAETEPDLWLLLPGKFDQWTLDTEAVLINLDALGIDPNTDSPILPVELVSKGFRIILDTLAVADCVQWADRLSNSHSDTVRFESFIYYVRFDAFLPRIGAPDPPPWEVTQRQLDLEFYEKLGAEDPMRPCRRDGCGRGAIRNSVMCKQHHFEMVKRRPCPFDP
jgi:hypothetical protein